MSLISQLQIPGKDAQNTLVSAESGFSPENSVGKSAVIAVWGPAGSPGRSTISASLVWCLADFEATRLVDADTYAPSQAISLGVDSETTPGLAFCLRSLTAGESVRKLITEMDVKPYREREMKLHTGLLRSEIWDELDVQFVAALLTEYRNAGRLTVFDLAASFESLNSAKDQVCAAVLDIADTVIAVCDASELGVLRFIRGMVKLREKYPKQNYIVVLNRTRKGMNKKSHSRIAQLLEKYGEISVDYFLPLSTGVSDAANEFAEPFTKVDSNSAISQEIEVIAKRILLQTLGNL